MLTLTRRGAIRLSATTLFSVAYTERARAEAAPADQAARAEVRRLVVRGRQLRYGEVRLRCAIGRGGISGKKREGDGATPAGVFPLREVFYRADRMARPETGLPVRALGQTDGWCDDPADPQYNRLVTLPQAAHHEVMWRDDGLYDLLAVIGFNDAPPVARRGSAIFLHVASLGWGATDGCVAVAADALRALLAGSGPGTEIDIGR